MEVEHEHPERLQLPRGHVLGSAVVSGDSDDGDGMSLSDDYKLDPEANPDDLYDKNLDNEDEAYVYKHLRGGIKETIQVRTSSRPTAQDKNNDKHENDEEQSPSKTDASSSAAREMKVYKPRNSDAVLSCPCCFHIVCMDCQRHRRYSNQFRAMFVMGIIVDWNTKLVYDNCQQVLVPQKATFEEEHAFQESLVPTEEDHETTKALAHIISGTGKRISYKEGEYFAVQCANCKTQVAALDMRDEVYHFHGCLESS